MPQITVRMTTSYEININIDEKEYNDPEQQTRIAYQRAIERRDEKPGLESWYYHDQTFKII